MIDLEATLVRYDVIEESLICHRTFENNLDVHGLCGGGGWGFHFNFKSFIIKVRLD